MCGIAGVYGEPGEARLELVRTMVERMAHRGPDGDGFFAGRRVALGMRRLAIVDPSHGHQPLYNEKRDVAVVFNGEIYNHLDLRRWLERSGHRFDSHTDGAILPHAYEELGTDFVERLNGIFAIAVWDERAQRLHLFRDKFGVKPLYWAGDERRLSFASEVKALLCDPAVPREVDAVALDQFLTFRFVPSPRTIFAGVRKLEPGTALTAAASGVTERGYWRETPRAYRRDRRNLIREYQEAFERAVVRQMMSDRPIGVMLSGGVDSGAITAVMARHSSQVRTFTMGFADGGDSNELSLARETAALLGTEHHELVVGVHEYRERLVESLALVEEPVGSTSALAVHQVAQMMRPDVPVALCGQGADEPLGGYRRHLGVKLAGRLQPLAPLLRHAADLPPLRANVRVRRGTAALLRQDALGRLMAAYRVLDDDAKGRLYRSDFSAQLDGAPPEERVERFRAEVAHLDLLGQMLYVDTRLWLPDELLLIADKMSMAASVELRVPFLDEDLVALIESMHSSQKLRGLSRKSIHKRAMLRWLPARIVYRKERGWQTPMREWLRAELRPLLVDVALDREGLCRQLFREQELTRMIDSHWRGESDLTRELFCLLSLGLWHRAFSASSSQRSCNAGRTTLTTT